jgi:hypothetical protein
MAIAGPVWLKPTAPEWRRAPLLTDYRSMSRATSTLMLHVLSFIHERVLRILVHIHLLHPLQLLGNLTRQSPGLPELGLCLPGA